MEDDIHDEDQLRGIIKEQNLTIDFVMEREDKTEIGCKRALDFSYKRAWKQKEEDAIKKWELET